MSENSMLTSVSSPCVGKCCLDNEDVCVGCKRHLDEISGWYSASKEEKRNILARCVERGNTQINVQD
jgi:predicted Fe-S protein YdhL (DUF1289 family)